MRMGEVIVTATPPPVRRAAFGKIALAERDLYEELFSGKADAYAEERTCQPGRTYLPAFLEIVGDQRGTVLDAGCATGTGALALEAAGFDVICCDLTGEGRLPEAMHFPFHEACLWYPLRPQIKRGNVDWVFCCDVLEHLPKQFTGLAIDHLLRVANRGVFLSVALDPDVFGAWVGRSLHQTVEGFTWWRDLCRELGTLVEARDLMRQAIYYVEPR